MLLWSSFIDVGVQSADKKAVLQVSSLTQSGTVLLSKNISAGTRTLQINVASLPSGIYVLTYSVEGQIIDSRKFTKK